MLQNAYLLAKIGADTAENEQHFAAPDPKADEGGEEGRRRAGLGGQGALPEPGRRARRGRVDATDANE